MNRYHIDLIVGGPLGILTNLVTVEADGFDYGEHGAYRFWKRIAEDDDVLFNKIENVAMYPIARTVIRKIEKINK
jgi:hypothetical protein